MCACSVGGFIALKFCLLRQTMHSGVKGCDAYVVYSLLWLCDPQWKKTNNHCDVNNGVYFFLHIHVAVKSFHCCLHYQSKFSRLLENQKKERSEKHFAELHRLHPHIKRVVSKCFTQIQNVQVHVRIQAHGLTNGCLSSCSVEVHQLCCSERSFNSNMRIST